MKVIKSNTYSIFFLDYGFNKLKEFIIKNNYSKIFVHVDNNTKTHCLNIFYEKIKNIEFEIIISDEGEENKNLDSCIKLWTILSNKNADRKSLIINLGGGVVGDMGGFVASTYKRGIDYINIPTTLLSMVDASIGGKTGVDLNFLKNQIGTFCEPKMIVIDPIFLQTLDKKEILSGYAEIFKHSIVSKSELFKKLTSNENFSFFDLEIIKKSIIIKNSIVLIDKKELDERKALNFGHTLGHAIETNSLIKKKRLLHGFAISIGFILESYISNILLNFPRDKVEIIKKHVINYFGKTNFSSDDINDIQKLLIHDKKNSHGKVNFLLLQDLGQPLNDMQVDSFLIKEAFDYYNS
tara:strand:- start:11924 stop:12979 length:1056 start_codon:yes stop_codon:yes gene_type:complete